MKYYLIFKKNPSLSLNYFTLRIPAHLKNGLPIHSKKESVLSMLVIITSK